VGRPLAPHRNIVRYCERVFARPAYIKAMELAAREPA
jgi:hypothetical protein